MRISDWSSDVCSSDLQGFGAKERDWNRTELVEEWRERWADHVNARLAELDIDARIDHRSYETQGIDLEPQDKIGHAAACMGEGGHESERNEDHRAVAQRSRGRLNAKRSEARCGWKERVRTYKTRWTQATSNKKNATKKHRTV